MPTFLIVTDKLVSVIVRRVWEVEDMVDDSVKSARNTATVSYDDMNLRCYTGQHAATTFRATPSFYVGGFLNPSQKFATFCRVKCCTESCLVAHVTRQRTIETTVLHGKLLLRVVPCNTKSIVFCLSIYCIMTL